MYFVTLIIIRPVFIESDKLLNQISNNYTPRFTSISKVRITGNILPSAVFFSIRADKATRVPFLEKTIVQPILLPKNSHIKRNDHKLPTFVYIYITSVSAVSLAETRDLFEDITFRAWKKQCEFL